jgi:hypothetical protein
LVIASSRSSVLALLPIVGSSERRSSAAINVADQTGQEMSKPRIDNAWQSLRAESAP